MRVNIYSLPGKVGLKFDSPKDRDQFWDGMASHIANGFSPQQAAEKIGQFAIRLYPDRVKEGFSWPAELLPVQSPTTAPSSPPAPSLRSEAPKAKPAPAKIIEPPTPGTTVTVGSGIDPFVRTGTNVTKALPGLVPQPPGAAAEQPATPEPPKVQEQPAKVDEPEPPPAPKKRGRPPKPKVD